MFDLDSALGIEVRRDKLIFAAVSKGLQDFTLKNHKIIENYRELPPLELRNQVAQYLKGDGLNRENVILGLSRDQVIVRRFELPLEVEENLEQVVRFQVEKLEPTEDERSYYDYLVAERDEKNKKILLEIVMVRGGLLDEYLSLFRELNLYPAAVRVSTVGLYQLFALHEDGFPRKEPYVVFNIDPVAVEIALIASGARFFSQRTQVAREDLSFERLVRELDIFLSATELETEAVARIYFTGALGEQFLEEFRSRFQDCEPLLKKANLKHKLTSVSHLDELADSIGLAVSGINKAGPARLNLIPAEKRVIGERPSLVPTVLLAGLLVMMGVAAGTRGYFQQQKLADQIEAEIQKYKPHVEEAMALREQIQQRQAQLAELQNLMKGRQRVLAVLRELTERLPEHAFLQNVNIQGDKVNITGHATSASSLLPVLMNSPQFRSVENRYITPDASVGKEKFNFEMVIR